MSEICPGLHAAAKITIFAKNWKNLRVDENMSKKAPTRTAISAKTAKITIFAKKLEKSSSRCKHVKEGPDKVCDFCDFCENYNFCKKLEKSSSRCQRGPWQGLRFLRKLPSCQACLRETKIKSPPILCSCIPLRPPLENEGCFIKLGIFTIHVTSRAWSLKNEGYSYMPCKSRAGSLKNEGYT